MFFTGLFKNYMQGEGGLLCAAGEIVMPVASLAVQLFLRVNKLLLSLKNSGRTNLGVSDLLLVSQKRP